MAPDDYDASMSNDEILTAIFNKFLSWGYSEKYARNAIRSMSIEDLGCFHEEHIKGQAK
jgi:hypothetical protein